ncbi:hypothetical protein A7K91_14890 [Paenibacillus oryzae]|uniref:Uncharacterized protein n=1 Tax=Paenibacillus oryzae TaxID=1844972 RepID=A0A1A5YTF5_9BACL|nr:hypothetical protein [Paenibacillus oryzae]OBR68916.1 hypothetical protein A7K91_14890 [Paenibacillus oryzae]
MKLKVEDNHMPFKDAFITFPILETERFILRELQTNDAQDYYNYFSDPEVPNTGDTKVLKMWRQLQRFLQGFKTHLL